MPLTPPFLSKVTGQGEEEDLAGGEAFRPPAPHHGLGPPPDTAAHLQPSNPIHGESLDFFPQIPPCLLRSQATPSPRGTQGPVRGITRTHFPTVCFLPFAAGLGGVMWPRGTWLPAVHHSTRGSGSAKTEDTQSVTNEKAITRDEDDKAAKCYLGPVLIAGLNHFPLPANGMHNCAGFPGVLHPYVFRLVTDALPWKPALGKRTIPGTVGSGRMQAPIWSLQLVSKN